ncbi:MAG: 4-alpha-glucanotransferase [Pseudomonadota bacterium]
MADDLLALAQAKGILPRYTDTTGTDHRTSPETAAALLRAIGTAVDSPAAIAEEHAQLSITRNRNTPLWIVLSQGQAVDFEWLREQAWQLTCESGESIEGRGTAAFPALPIGIHRLWIGGQKTVLLVAPERLALPERCWGVMVPLWGLRSAAQGGLGDFADLAKTAKGMAGSGAGFLGINPVHAGFPTDPDAISPYQPSHRRRLNTLCIPVSDAASGGDLIDYPAENAVRRAALEAAFAAASLDGQFDAFCAQGGAALMRFARHQALAEQHGPYWTDWPEKLHDPDHPDCQAIAPERLRFHLWAQWRADFALGQAQNAAKGAGLRHGLYLDLAVGTHPAGAETWEDRESFVRGVSLGAPPDALGPQGQTWNLAPLDPDALIAQDFRPLAETLRQQFRHCGILRIDHILGFERAFWVPENGAPGAYMAMPRNAMLAVARIEAARAGGYVVGEDLGVVPDGLRAALDASGILGCRLAMFERQGHGFTPAAQYAEAAITSFSTHDLPTWRGWREGADLAAWAKLGAMDEAALDGAAARRRSDLAAFDAVAGPGIADLHEFLARSRSRLVAVQAETLLNRAEQPNMPGTVDEYPNWRQRLPVDGAKLGALAAFKDTAALMADHGRG